MRPKLHIVTASLPHQGNCYAKVLKSSLPKAIRFCVFMLSGAGWPVCLWLLSDCLPHRSDDWPCSAAPWGPQKGLLALMARAHRPCQQIFPRAVVAAKPETPRFLVLIF